MGDWRLILARRITPALRRGWRDTRRAPLPWQRSRWAAVASAGVPAHPQNENPRRATIRPLTRRQRRGCFCFCIFVFCRQPVARRPARHPRPAQTPRAGGRRRVAAARPQLDSARLPPPRASRLGRRHDRSSARWGGAGRALDAAPLPAVADYRGRLPAARGGRLAGAPKKKKTGPTWCAPARGPLKRRQGHRDGEKSSARDAVQRERTAGGGNNRAAGARPAHPRHTRAIRVCVPPARSPEEQDGHPTGGRQRRPPTVEVRSPPVRLPRARGRPASPPPHGPFAAHSLTPPPPKAGPDVPRGVRHPVTRSRHNHGGRPRSRGGRRGRPPASDSRHLDGAAAPACRAARRPTALLAVPPSAAGHALLSRTTPPPPSHASARARAPRRARPWGHHPTAHYCVLSCPSTARWAAYIYSPSESSAAAVAKCRPSAAVGHPVVVAAAARRGARRHCCRHHPAGPPSPAVPPLADGVVRPCCCGGRGCCRRRHFRPCHRRRGRSPPSGTRRLYRPGQCPLAKCLPCHHGTDPVRGAPQLDDGDFAFLSWLTCVSLSPPPVSACLVRPSYPVHRCFVVLLASSCSAIGGAMFGVHGYA